MALSFYNGYKRIDRLIDFVRRNIIGLETLDEMQIIGGKEILENALNGRNKKQQINYQWQIRYLGLGLLCFVGWLVGDIYVFK